MPAKVERSLAKSAKKRGLTGTKRKAYIFGTMNSLGMLKTSPRTRKKK